MEGRQPALSGKGISESSYAVHRPSEAGASSTSSQPEYQDEDRSNTPPPYSGPTSSSMTAPTPRQPQPAYPGLPRLDYRLYSPETFTLSSDHTTITSYEPRLSSNANALVSLIKTLATVPPKPQIRILGRSSDGTVDFDVKINLMHLIVPGEEKRGQLNYVGLIGPREMGMRGEARATTAPALPDLDAWARRYCEDQGAIKHFALEREITNWDTQYLEGRLLSLIASTSYRGHTTLTFPLTHKKVIIHSPDKVNRFFSNVTKVFTGTRKYEVVKAFWPYADVARGESGRRCAVQEEEAWFADWRDAITHAIMGRRQGWVTSEDRLEFLMEPRVRDTTKPADWGRF